LEDLEKLSAMLGEAIAAIAAMELTLRHGFSMTHRFIDDFPFMVGIFPGYVK
jgi:hypothetical protein